MSFKQKQTKSEPIRKMNIANNFVFLEGYRLVNEKTVLLTFQKSGARLDRQPKDKT